jgi:hypothetical protein
MKIIGHHWIEESIRFKAVKSIEDINKTVANDTLLFNNLSKNIEIIKYADKNSLPFAIKIDNIKDVIFAHNLNANYIIAPKDISKIVQDIAQNYLFDSLIFVEIDTEDEIEYFAKLGVDGVIL